MSLLLVRLREALRPAYEVERELGRGGMGIVYLAQDVALRRPVAVKILKPELATEPAVDAFHREARALARISSRHVVTVHTVGEAGGLSYFVMEYIDAPSLEQRLTAGPMAQREAGYLARDLLKGLEAIHERNVVHRDLKPSNIFVAADRAVIGDFGIAQLEDDTGTGMFRDPRVGTAGYMAPEQLAGERPTRQSDLYQLGVVLYEAWTGRRWKLHAPAIPGTWTGVPRRVASALRTALEPDPARRFPEARDFRQALAGARPLWVRGAPVAAILSLLAVGLLRNPSRPSDRLQPHVALTVLPFAAEDSTLGAALTRYTGERLERFGRIPTRPLTLSDHAVPRSQEAIARLNSSYFVTGHIGADSVLVLAVHDTTGRVLRELSVPRAGFDRLAWGRAAADSLIHRFFPRQYDEYRSMAGRGGSGDARAVDAYLAAEQAFQRDAYTLADRRYSAALELDPAFAIAAWQRALVRRWRRILSPDDLRELHQRDSAALDARYVRLLAAQLQPDLAARFAAYRGVIADYPSFGSARLLYADERFHRGALVGLPLDSALADMRLAMDADSALDQAPVLDHLIWGHVRLGDWENARDALLRRKVVARLHRTAEYEEGHLRTRVLQLAFDQRFRPWWGGLKLWWMGRNPDATLVAAMGEYAHLGNAFDIPHAQLAFGEALVTHGGRDSLRAVGYEAQGLARVLLGQPGAAVTDFDSAAALFDTDAARLEAAQWRLLAPSLGLPAFDSMETDRARLVVRRLLTHATLGARAHWTLGMEASYRGDPAPARDQRAELRPEPLTRLLLAMDTARAGAEATALTMTDSLIGYESLVRNDDPFARALLHLERGKWLLAGGRNAAAERALLWYENGDIDGWGQGEAQAGMVDAALSGIARLRRAEARGHDATGCAMLRRVRALWRDAEPRMQPVRDSLARQLDACRR